MRVRFGHVCSRLRRRVWRRVALCAATGIMLLLVLNVATVTLPSSLPSETGVFKAVGARSCVGGPTVYVVTPTYRRATQAPDLVRLSQALMLAEARIFWVVVEDAERPSTLITQVQRVGVFPVGMIDQQNFSSPVVSPDGRVVGFHDPYGAARAFRVDMAGFAVNMSLVLSSANPTMPYKRGHLETAFLESLGVTINDLEPLANNCTEVLAWHTHIGRRDFPSGDAVLGLNFTSPNNLPLLYQNILEGV
ncbi:galactosylgalactosylxylosylprotein 3-beta-glucuronosyltransferase S-like isoform X2 [Dermacentor albipictus]|uniref:galactosylgalactosylxylosylprotein 3-beta-glucuronosyltransferase S-like isoform X2 n=1 Tax=Dermacentor albipictus TaxID=60249 RepID=UPI0038FCC1D7